MEFLKFSKFKLQLQTLISQVRDLREREQSATEQVHFLIQKQKHTEANHLKRLQELQEELDSSNELRHKMERQVNLLETENQLLENKQKLMQGTIQNLLQSKEAFVHAYEESTCEMKRSIESRDKRIDFLSTKLRKQLELFEAIEKGAFLVKQVVENVECLVSEKEQVVDGLRSRMDNVFVFEKTFIEKISELENRARIDSTELLRKDKIISELQGQLETARISNNYHPQLDELQQALSAKEILIQNLFSENQGLQFELGKATMILEKFQKAVTRMNDEDKRAFCLQPEEHIEIDVLKEDNRLETTRCIEENACKVPRTLSGEKTACNVESSECQECDSVSNTINKNKNCGSCLSEIACSGQQSTPAEPQLAPGADVLNISMDETKNCKASGYHLDSEGSTTQGEALDNPG